MYLNLYFMIKIYVCKPGHIMEHNPDKKKKKEAKIIDISVRVKTNFI